MSDVKHKISVRGREKVGNVVTYLVLFLFIALMIIPIFWGFLTSWKGTAEISRFPPTIFPEIIDIGNFYKVLFMSNFSTYFMNSVIVTVTCVVISTVIAGHAAYALARFRIKHREKIMFAILMTSMVPAVALLIPLYIMSVRAGLYNTENHVGFGIYSMENTNAYMDFKRIF